MADGEKMSYVDRLGVAVALTGAVVTVVVAVIEERPASAVAIAVGAVLFMALGLSYLWRSRSPDGQRRFPRLRIGAAIAAALVGVASVFATAVPSLRRTIAHDVFGFTDLRRDVAIAQVVVAQSPDWYRLEVTVINETGAEQLVRSAQLVIYLTDGLVSSCSGSGPHYRINDRIRMVPQGTGSTSHIDGTVQTMPDAPEFTTEVTGELRATCSDAVMALRFPTQLILPAHEHTQFTVDLPKQFKAPGPYPYPIDYVEPAGGEVDESAGVTLAAAAVFRIICVADPPVSVPGQHLIATRPTLSGWSERMDALAPTACIG